MTHTQRKRDSATAIFRNRMKIPKWAKSIQMDEKMKLEVLRSIKLRSRAIPVVHCSCGRGCRQCYGKPHCGCRICYQPLWSGIQNCENFMEDHVVEMSVTENKTAKIVDHYLETAKITNKPSIKHCRGNNIVFRRARYFCLSCHKDICRSCVQSTCLQHRLVFLGTGIFHCTTTEHQ